MPPESPALALAEFVSVICVPVSALTGRTDTRTVTVTVALAASGPLALQLTVEVPLSVPLEALALTYVALIGMVNAAFNASAPPVLLRE